MGSGSWVQDECYNVKQFRGLSHKVDVINATELHTENGYSGQPYRFFRNHN